MLPPSGTMPHYRIYKLTPEGHVASPPAVVECADDDAVKAHAQALLDGADIEVWQEKRLVVRLKGTQP
jgi:hypothetical protein